MTFCIQKVEKGNFIVTSYILLFWPVFNTTTQQEKQEIVTIFVALILGSRRETVVIV